VFAVEAKDARVLEAVGAGQEIDMLDRSEFLENLPEAPWWQLRCSTRTGGVLGQAHRLSKR